MLGARVAASTIRIVWHLPMMPNGGLRWLVGTVCNAAFTMVTLQLLVRSGGHWTPAAVWHATLNAFGSSFLFLMVTGDDKEEPPGPAADPTPEPMTSASRPGLYG
jgi:hypothetical protein